MTMSSITNPVRESFSDQPRVGVNQLKVPQVVNVQLETLGSVERHKVSVRKSYLNVFVQKFVFECLHIK